MNGWTIWQLTRAVCELSHFYCDLFFGSAPAMLRTDRKLGTMKRQAHGGQTQKSVGATRTAQLSELQHRNEMVALNANRRDDHRACFRLRRLLIYVRDQIHGQGDQYSTPEAIGTASPPRCLGRAPGTIRAVRARQLRRPQEARTARRGGRAQDTGQASPCFCKAPSMVPCCRGREHATTRRGGT